VVQKLSFFVRRAWLSKLRRFRQWWWREFLELFPERVAQRLLGRGRALLTIAPGADVIGVELMTERRERIASTSFGVTEFAPDAIEQFLRSHGFAREDVDSGLRLSSERFFTRKLILPAEAGDAIGEIVGQDLLRKTPFRPQDIFHGYAVAHATVGDKITVWQWIVRREFVARALETIGIEEKRVAFIESLPGPEPNELSPLIWLRPHELTHASWSGRLALVLGCTALVLILALGGHRYWRQQIVLEELEASVAATQTKAQQVRVAFDQLRQKQSVLVQLRTRKRNASGLLDIWEETTRLLPSHSWLTELRLSETNDKREQQITLLGFSDAATNLIGILERSPLLANAALIAPVALDPVERRERFALQAKINNRDAPKEPMR
jgi:general secretion pathway protein L